MHTQSAAVRLACFELGANMVTYCQDSLCRVASAVARYPFGLHMCGTVLKSGPFLSLSTLQLCLPLFALFALSVFLSPLSSLQLSTREEVQRSGKRHRNLKVGFGEILKLNVGFGEILKLKVGFGEILKLKVEFGEILKLKGGVGEILKLKGGCGSHGRNRGNFSCVACGMGKLLGPVAGTTTASLTEDELWAHYPMFHVNHRSLACVLPRVPRYSLFPRRRDQRALEGGGGKERKGGREREGGKGRARRGGALTSNLIHQLWGTGVQWQEARVHTCYKSLADKGVGVQGGVHTWYKSLDRQWGRVCRVECTLGTSLLTPMGMGVQGGVPGVQEARAQLRSAPSQRPRPP
eukprot:3483107-Rhodomonas_salina.2